AASDHVRSLGCPAPLRRPSLSPARAAPVLDPSSRSSPCPRRPEGGRPMTQQVTATAPSDRRTDGRLLRWFVPYGAFTVPQAPAPPPVAAARPCRPRPGPIIPQVSLSPAPRRRSPHDSAGHRHCPVGPSDRRPPAALVRLLRVVHGAAGGRPDRLRADRPAADR